MFGKEDAITDNECCPDFFPDYQENYQIILKYDGPIVFVLMELGRQIYSNSIFVFFQDYQRSCQNLSSWRAIFVEMKPLRMWLYVKH